jgi:hypothetical protein
MTEEMQQQPSKKGLSPWAWIAIGCGGLIIIAFVLMSAGMWFAGKKIQQVAEDFEDNPAKSAAELLVKMNPELEMVESDEDEGTLTIRVKETGEVATFDYSEIEEGKIRFESDEGSMTFDADSAKDEGFITVETDEGTSRWGTSPEADQIPDWLPKYPGAAVQQAGFTSQTADSNSGSYAFETTDSPGEVLSFFRQELEAAGFSVQENSMSEDGTVQGGFLTATSEADDRQAQVTVSSDGEKTQGSIFYSESPG